MTYIVLFKTWQWIAIYLPMTWLHYYEMCAQNCYISNSFDGPMALYVFETYDLTNGFKYIYKTKQVTK